MSVVLDKIGTNSAFFWLGNSSPRSRTTEEAKETDMIANKMDSSPRMGDAVEELSLLLPGWQVMALADAAELEGLTVAQYMRRLVAQALATENSSQFL
jgi:hypothetical protein